MSVLAQVPDGGRILVIRLRSLGDCVLTTPALAILRAYRRDCRIGVVVEDRFRDVFAGNPAVDAILPPEYGAVARFRADLCLNLHGGTRSVLLTAASLARWRAGFGHYAWARVHNVRIPRAQEVLGEERTVHTAEHLVSAMFYLGVPRCEIPRAFLSAGTEGRPPRPYAVLHPMASAAAKTWPAERFVAVARELRSRHGLEPVFIAGPGEDVAAFHEFETRCARPLREIKSLLAGASLFVGNDSGPAHMAAAFGVPVVVLFGSSDPVVWAPWRTAAETIVAPEGLANVTVEDVLAALDRLRVRT